MFLLSVMVTELNECTGNIIVYIYTHEVYIILGLYHTNSTLTFIKYSFRYFIYLLIAVVMF